MRVEIAWWELAGSPETIDSLREHLDDVTVNDWAHVPTLRLKMWVADRQRNRWGAVMVWESERPDWPLPANRAAELIGRPADHRTEFEVAVAVAGASSPDLGSSVDVAGS